EPVLGRGPQMYNSPTRIVLLLTVGGLLGVLAVPRESVEPPPNQVPDRPAQPVPVARPPATIDAKQPGAILFKNVKVFDGKSDKVTANTSVLVVGNKIEKIAGDIVAPEKATVIDGGGRRLMPGLIEAHWHGMLGRPTAADALPWGVGEAHMVSGAGVADEMLWG